MLFCSATSTHRTTCGESNCSGAAWQPTRRPPAGYGAWGAPTPQAPDELDTLSQHAMQIARRVADAATAGLEHPAGGHDREYSHDDRAEIG
ncbi:hypothetical protein [Actinomadura miaoliensis]|uniref:hypothetical protein n=1 Tax=Actinomadura miaoliensis TaxID=430685 RepID=UPI0031E62CAE